ncbi:MAG: class I SAM-dependent methyltransferase [Proteobacteria bacterium]|nr:class I SAM-dependent methyltransferase [Pseudomonadota bacterium]
MWSWSKIINKGRPNKDKPNAPSCERNQQAILKILKGIIEPIDKNLLEIGSGTGQHAVFMAPHFRQLQWQTSDLIGNHSGINMWLDEANLDNVSAPIVYQSGKSDFPDSDIDVVFTTNTLHIMSWQNVKNLIAQLGKNLKSGAKIIIYGPFNYNGQFTSESNAKFDGWLKAQESHRGIRDFETIVQLMADRGIQLKQDIEMPANNRILYFVKS